MQEVIFSGTQIRTTSGMAEVSLIFDNSQNILSVSYSEVTVTRKLFRSGESEYFINKNQCRLKDVRDIFLDSGLGVDSYSIIEQGKIDFLVAAKPENRRELFEEVAGVAKYKVRREETLKKLERIDTDISCLSDILTIHKQQMTALDLAVTKAKQYKEYQENLAKYEISYLVYCVTCNNIEIERTKRILDDKVKEFKSDNTLLEQFNLEIQKLRLNLDETNERHLNVNKDLSEIRTQIGVADKMIQHAMQRETEIKSEQEVLEKEQQYNSVKVKLLEIESKKNRFSCEFQNLNLKKEASQFKREIYRNKNTFKYRYSFFTKDSSKT
ncbi:MAG: hypothetical protein Nk1A_3460 [Endomicrobiia bacterium]|nr:MAG: hypothetical protein Nk1A_3460 [Endomicrobiia bacterium]